MRPVSLVASLLLAAGTALPTLAASTITVDDSGGQDHTTIQAAINAATAGDTVYVYNGNYSESLDIVDKPLILEGESEGSVVIDASAFADYSIDARNTTAAVGQYTFRKFTLLGNASGSNSYGLKIAGDNVTTTVEAVTVSGCKRTGIDLNGLAGGIVDDVMVTGTITGNGVALTDCSNVTLSNLTTSGNAWGGLAIYTQGTYFTGGSDGVVLTPGGNSFSESPQVYTEVGGGYPITNLSVSTAEFAAQVGRIPTVDHTFFVVDLATGKTAIAAAGALAAQTWLLDRVTGTYHVDPLLGMKFGPGINAAPVNGLVLASGGTVEEQLHVTKNLTIQGAGKALTTIESPVALTASFITGGSTTNKPVVFIDGATDVTIRDLSVDGLGRGNGNYRFQGIGFWNGGGKVLDCDVTGIRETPINGNQHGVGIYAFNDTGGPYAIEVGGCDIDHFQKNGFGLSGTGLTVNVHDCNVVGYGDADFIAQNGIQISFGAGGTVTDCTASGFRYTPATAVSTGLLIYQGATVAVDGIAVTNSQEPIYWQEANGSLEGYDVTGGDFDGIFIYNPTVALAPTGDRVVSPLLEEPTGSQRPGPMATTYAVSILGGCLTGTGAPGTSGIWVTSGGGPTNVAVSNARITNYDTGVVAQGAAANVDINDSFLAGNVTAGFDNTLSGASQDATGNWWGDVSGPGGVGSGSGDAVLGSNVDFAGFLAGSGSSTACAFTSTGTNTVGPVNPGVCANATQPCVAVPVAITRVENSHMRGFSVDIQLDDLTLCGSITQGTYLNSIGSTAYQVVDNGGGSYTVDCAILGSPCGQTAATGTLFTVHVTGPDGVGSIEVTDVTFRDCTNGPIAGSPGAPLAITVDTAGPIPIANAATTQVKSGNDADGTTDVTVTFTLPGDAVGADTEVYRAPYLDNLGNNAYPEYNDVAGGAPTAPTTYPPALPWTLTSVLNSGDTDEVAQRGFWYYVVYTKDACGNWSLASNMTDGVLNYHLGDVTNGVTNGAGNNVVNTADVSLLGTNYGITLAPSDPVNYLDVGPTDDFSVDGFPLTDNKVQFEDLIMFAINYGTVSLTEPVDYAIDLAPKDGKGLGLALQSPTLQADGTLRARLVLTQPGALVQGIHARVDYESEGLELLEVGAGDLLDAQNAGVFFDTIEEDGSVSVDAAVLGQGASFVGSGAYADLVFRVREAGARPVLGEIALRDGQNRELTRPRDEVEAGDDREAPAPTSPSLTSRELPTATALLGAFPNPFQDGTAIRFQLATSDDVRVELFDVSGRQVATLHSGVLPAGTHEVTWNGRNAEGAGVDAGVYLYRVRIGAETWSAKLVLDR